MKKAAQVPLIFDDGLPVGVLAAVAVVYDQGLDVTLGVVDSPRVDWDRGRDPSVRVVQDLFRGVFVDLLRSNDGWMLGLREHPALPHREGAGSSELPGEWLPVLYAPGPSGRVMGVPCLPL